MAGDDTDWLFDYIMEVFQAPSWEVPIMTFIDEHCTLFDGEDENKLVYTDLHQEFCELIESLLEQHLEEIGVTVEQFVKICETGRNRRDVNRMVFDQILAVDDFLTFKALMQKRNMELELEAVRALQAMSQAERAAAAEEGGDKSTIDDVESALRQSLEEMEAFKADHQLELAELEAAIAASLALEEERLRVAREEAKAAEAAIAAAEADEEAEVTQTAVPTVSASPARRGDIVPPTPLSSPVPSQIRSPSPAPAPAPAAALAPLASPPRVAAPAPAPATPAAAAAVAEPLVTMKPIEHISLGPVAGGLAAQPLPALRAQREAVQEKAAAAFQQSHRLREELRETTAAATASVGEEDLRARAEHLRAMRDRLHKQKQEARQASLRAFETEKKTSTKAEEDKVRVAAALAATAEAEAKAKAEEEERMAMRVALARRLKADVLAQQESSRAAPAATTSAAPPTETLEERMARVEEQRRKAKEAELATSKQLQEAAAQRARVMAALRTEL